LFIGVLSFVHLFQYIFSLNCAWFISLRLIPSAIFAPRCQLAIMTDFAKLEAMVDSALPFVREWASDDHRRAHLEICLAGCAAVARHLASRFHWTLISVLCSLAAKVLITQEEAQAELAPSGWITDRTHPCSVVTFTLSLPVEQAHLLVFQLSGALSVVTEWGQSSSPLLTPEDHLVFRHLRSMLFDLITAARLGAGGRATDQLMDELPNLGQPAPQE
jgi:hypothetical protein